MLRGSVAVFAIVVIGISVMRGQSDRAKQYEQLEATAVAKGAERSEGAVAGWSWDYGDFRHSQPRELVRTPIRGLFMAGVQAFSGLFMGGVPTAMESGLRAAHAVLEDTGPTDEVLIPSRT